MLELQSISKKYDQQDILENVDFSIGEKEFISIIGKSGAGKTTLLSIIAGLVRPDSGKILFHGEDISHFNEECLARFRLMNVGIVFQDFKIIPSLSVYDNVYLALHPRKDIAKDKRKEMVEKMVTRVGLQDQLDQSVDTLSGGEKQRVAIARSLVGMPKLVLADEPTGNLDEKTSEDIIKLFGTLHNELNTTFIVITHDKEVASMAQKSYQLTNHTLHII